MSPRQVEWLVDTGYLLAFGAVPIGTRYLSDLFHGQLGVPPAVRGELADIATAGRHSSELNAAAGKFTGRSADSLLDIEFTQEDVPERDSVLSHLRFGTLPSEAVAVVPEEAAADPSEVSELPAVTTGENAGESEAIAICVRLDHPLLMNDGKATAYALHRGVRVEPAAASLIRLKTQMSAKEMFQLSKRMSAVTYVGAVVTGPMWFRQPVPSTEVRPAEVQPAESAPER